MFISALLCEVSIVFCLPVLSIFFLGKSFILWSAKAGRSYTVYMQMRVEKKTKLLPIIINSACQKYLCRFLFFCYSCCTCENCPWPSNCSSSHFWAWNRKLKDRSNVTWVKIQCTASSIVTLLVGKKKSLKFVSHINHGNTGCDFLILGIQN